MLWIVLSVALTVLSGGCAIGRIRKGKYFDSMLWGMLMGLSSSGCWFFRLGTYGGLVCGATVNLTLYGSIAHELDMYVLRHSKGDIQSKVKQNEKDKFDLVAGLAIGNVVGFFIWTIIYAIISNMLGD